MITESAQEGDPKGFLIDLDMASKADSESNSGAFHRTGTREFMAIEVVGRTARHTYRHDLESFFYVLLWICINYNSAGKPVKPRPDVLDGWSSTLAAADKAYNMGPSRFEGLLKKLADGFEVLKDMLRQLREKLFQSDGGEVFTGSPVGDHGPLYNGIIDVINGQLIRARQEVAACKGKW
jgi:hypothetical protein